MFIIGLHTAARALALGVTFCFVVVPAVGCASQRASQIEEEQPAAKAIPKPRLRGVSHQWAFFVSVALDPLISR